MSVQRLDTPPQHHNCRSALDDGGVVEGGIPTARPGDGVQLVDLDYSLWRLGGKGTLIDSAFAPLCVRSGDDGWHLFPRWVSELFDSVHGYHATHAQRTLTTLSKLWPHRGALAAAYRLGHVDAMNVVWHHIIDRRIERIIEHGEPPQ